MRRARPWWRDIAAVARAVQAEQTIGDWKQTAVAHAAMSSDSSDTSVASFSSAASSSSAETRVILHKRSATRAECLAACAAVGTFIHLLVR